MNIQTIRYTVELTLNAPILTQTAGAIGFGFDAAMCRDGMERPAIPGSMIKGNLRHAWREMSQISGSPGATVIKRWLGDASPEGSNDEPERGALIFSQYWSDESWSNAGGESRRYRISIDENTGAVEQGALQIIESPYPVGVTPCFTGTITVTLPESEQCELAKWLLKGFHFIPAVGALKGNGFGRIVNIGMNHSVLTRTGCKIESNLAGSYCFGLRIIPDRPICFAIPAIGKNNHFETEMSIPGAALIAAMANRTRTEPGKWPSIERHLSRLGITHAHPVQVGANRRPVAIPLSLVKSNNGYHDIAEQELAELINGEAPVFPIDWKEDEWRGAHACYNPANNPVEPTVPDKVLTIRTMINADTQTAEKNKLFSMESIDPAGFEWLANMDISRIEEPGEREMLATELHDMFKQPLTHLGKTKASATIRLEQQFAYTASTATRNDNQIIIYLQTPARLLPTAFRTNGTNDGERLKQAYRDSWEELSDNSLELSHFYAQQRLLGGGYWWNRFRKPHFTNGCSYHPEIFTCAGSVFVLKITDQTKAQEKIEGWLKYGLPQLGDAPGGENWKQNPWIATNGFGELAINIKPAQAETESTDE